MTTNHYRFVGQGPIANPEQNWQRLQQRLLAPLDDPENYHIGDPGLVAAVNTAITLGMPLLLTGEPGVGKTQLAHRIAYELGCEAIEFPVKSTSEAQDLFYHIDQLRRLHAAQTSKSANDDAVDIRHFLRFQGLGLAILRAMPTECLAKLKLEKHAWPDQETPCPRQPSVVLIDEIDKAPMDFCNDMLEEIRRLQFLIPELDTHPLSIYANPKQPDDNERKFRPQVIITSNSEKGLPEAFLRRCIYYHIQPPSQAQLLAIIHKRLGESGNLPINLPTAIIHRCVEFYNYLKQDCNLEKPPSTAELLNWLLVIKNNALRPNTETWQYNVQVCLLKHKDDASRIVEFFEHFPNRAKKLS